MAWPTPKFSKSRVDRAARQLTNLDLDLSDDEFSREWDVFDDWRMAHNYPLSVLHSRLRTNGAIVEPQSLIVHRLKRHVSIFRKLLREKTRLTQMQDIGGCRAIVSDLDKVRRVVDVFRRTELIHVLDHEDDYIQNPRESGYRGVHLIYRFRSEVAETAPYDQMKIEIQARTTLQHAWATAVETVGTYTNQALKSSQGAADYLRFFALMGSAMALKEGTPIVPNTPHEKTELIEEIRVAERRLNFRQRFEFFGRITSDIEMPPGAQLYLLDLNPQEKTITVIGFSQKSVLEAHDAYSAAEKTLKGEADPRQIVLVSASSLDALRSAYRNYFLNTDEFSRIVADILEEDSDALL